MERTLACLAAWMPRQRWYAGQGRVPALRLVASVDLPGDDPAATIRTLLIADDASSPPTLYQVPVVSRSRADAAPAHLIGVPEGDNALVDGAHDRAYADALLRLIRGAETAPGSGAMVTGVPATDWPGGQYTSEVLAGEQSNTSIILRPGDQIGRAIIIKVYRQVHPGLNPDIELQTALASTDAPHVPPAMGSLHGEWPDPEDGSPRNGSLAFAQAFLPGVEDAWRVALRAAAAGEDFSPGAAELGRTVATVHAQLARLFPTAPLESADRAGMREIWQRRLDLACARIPEIAELCPQIAAVYDRAAAQECWPDAQRVHGDLHLGQVIQARTGEWVLLDFEGEPLRPMAERLAPDLALRDVAGMLRSFDYVAASIRLGAQGPTTTSARTWADTARTAFLRGYDEVAHASAPSDLLRALELDKAVYEADYEARHRPTWLRIPVRAIRQAVTTGI